MAEDGTEPEEAASGQESSATVAGLTITPVKMELEYEEDRLYLDLENTTDEDLYVEWTRVMFTEKAEDAGKSGMVSDPGEETCCIKAHDVHQEVFTLSTCTMPPTYEEAWQYTYYAVATAVGTVTNADKSLSEKIDFTFPIGKDDIESAEMSEPKANSVHFEEQEFYNDGTVLFTVPEQTVEPGYSSESTQTPDGNIHYERNPYYKITVHYENNSDDTGMWYGYALVDGKVNGVAPQPDAMDSANFLKGNYLQLISRQSSDKDILIKDELQVPFNDGEDSGEITFTLSLKVKDTDEVFSETPVTIHYTVVK